MKVLGLLVAVLTFSILETSCMNDESYSTSTADSLSFTSDTIHIDTVFTSTPSSTRSFWVYNRGQSALRLANVRLAGGNQTGFRVNVDGTSLNAASGYRATGLEVRKGDSLRVFVEITAASTGKVAPVLLGDDLIFSLESGVEQKVHLEAWAWDAVKINNLEIKRDTTIATAHPIVVYGKIVVTSGATLKIGAGTSLYFHSQAGIDVKGTLVCEGTPGNEVLLRGDRLDKMLDDLPYGKVSGQWNGVHLFSGSIGNHVSFTGLYGACDGLVCDSSAVLTIEHATIHNCKGVGLSAYQADVTIKDTEISNTLNECLLVNGGSAYVQGVTLAQFYPFDAARGAALRITNTGGALQQFACYNTLVTGYDADVVSIGKQASAAFSSLFSHCILRTPVFESTDGISIQAIAFENVADTISGGARHFMKVDAASYSYDFRLSEQSTARNKADAATSSATDRLGTLRGNQPAIGAYEYR